MATSSSSKGQVQTVIIRRAFDPKKILLTENDRRRRYKTNFVDRGLVPKWGQMKLLMGEIIWLSNHWNRQIYPKIILVVAGGASGMHYAAISEMYEDILEIHLWDTNPFAMGLDKIPKIKLHRKLMFEEDARREYSNSPYPIFFASDLRSISETHLKSSGAKYSKREIEEGIWKDHELQRRLMEAVNPVSACLKFRLPYYLPTQTWQPKYKDYLSGYVYKQCFNGASSSESRLIPMKKDGVWQTCRYSCQEYEEKLFWHNTCVRADWSVSLEDGRPYISEWLNTIDGSSAVPDDGELRNSFDAVYAMYILDRYLSFIGEKFETLENRFLAVMELWNWCRDTINTHMKNKVSLSKLRENFQIGGAYKSRRDEDSDDEDGNYIFHSMQSTESVPTLPPLERAEFIPTHILPGVPGSGGFVTTALPANLEL